MPVLALCEKGLILDALGKQAPTFKCEDYKVNNNRLVSVHNSKVKFLNLIDLLDVQEVDIPGFTELKQSPDGMAVAILCYNKILRIYKNSILVNEIENVENFGISNKFYCASSKKDVKMFHFDTKEPICAQQIEIKAIHCLNQEIVLVTEKSPSQKILLFKNGKIYKMIEHPQIFRTVVKCNENSILILADTEYTSKSYYAEATLYLIKFNDLDKLEQEYKKTVDCKDQKLISLNELFGVISFPSLKKIHSFGYQNNKIYVCFGDQPAHAHFYTLHGFYDSRLSKAVRNQLIFNRSGKRVINAGFGNLPGIIEIFENGASICYFESLGASNAAWLPDDSRFIVATTNYFKSDNKICLYDYYGKLLESIEYKSLISTVVYGNPEPEITIIPPENILKQTIVAAYVPPHLKAGSLPIIKPIIPKPKAKKSAKGEKVKKEARTIETVKEELKESIEIREKSKKGEELSLEEENKILKIKSLENELESFQLNKSG